jgi:hypothetical protein
VDWAEPILQQPLKVVDGCVLPPDRPGTGLVWDADAVSHFRRGYTSSCSTGVATSWETRSTAGRPR